MMRYNTVEDRVEFYDIGGQWVSVAGSTGAVDIKFIRSQYKQDTENQELWDKLYEKVLKVKGGRNSYQYRTELKSVVDGKETPVS